MLRVWSASGQELAEMTVDGFMNGLATVMALKHHLRRLYGFPVCQQQIVHGGSCLDDHSTLNPPIDVQLVILSCPESNEAAKELISGCRR